MTTGSSRPNTNQRSYEGAKSTTAQIMIPFQPRGHSDAFHRVERYPADLAIVEHYLGP
jgi:hypothetical protein